MAKSRFEYVKQFELEDPLLPHCWIVIRLDGKGFTRFSELHNFKKPNDEQALRLMNRCAVEVLEAFPDIRIAFGESDEYSFVFSKTCKIYGRRSSKLVSLVTSCFSGNYVRWWPEHFPSQPLLCTPIFDGRAVCYPTDHILRHYLAWRQADTHINNQYNTCFWALVHSGKSRTEAQDHLKGTQTAYKNELLFSEFGIKYGLLPVMFRKGSVVTRSRRQKTVKHAEDGTAVQREGGEVTVTHEDIIDDAFWETRPDILM
ncbi:histidine tRNA 5'-guanylyltransferase [Coccomyxa subellipsoidea C-169]|uniref:tRNA(His) guanylyltransferase n=1 Tax=Coccomyxa subellipsoidea (strain C-169) TaxID=574566 RepID=I0YT96_COCSC|nr:histidine tRNA 5'-guanylyltransferase [Coccomyxa subellipsoidea C-169]EIE21615.1 histidine tRNA 5'-guanylyltransferase [Coccomyxa subellipsoidea C-169]|eukprot:XP_005646159.1 histidine tRNA 5'-guanylyltransferase [Coccomyxa subellipsoidea C-169]